jgi:hypothetical protein
VNWEGEGREKIMIRVEMLRSRSWRRFECKVKRLRGSLPVSTELCENESDLKFKIKFRSSFVEDHKIRSNSLENHKIRSSSGKNTSSDQVLWSRSSSDPTSKKRIRSGHVL